MSTDEGEIEFRNREQRLVIGAVNCSQDITERAMPRKPFGRSMWTLFAHGDSGAQHISHGH
jgi:hypothetical protein